MKMILTTFLNRMLNCIKVKNSPWHENTSLEFDSNGLWLRVSLNVPKSLASKLSPNNVAHGKTFSVYALRMFIPTEMVCKQTLETTQKMLLENCMKNIRNAKSKICTTFKVTVT